ncbi:30S ribosomal protein S16 [Megalodesulfovibrio gigas]|uniref:Small ribosomal subunit protein bS16 n=1 Tax=Megalodesulfovibrio gigas (strain ATCC 19364 / DSM 1382 / NCIMB 9332 / VKM B-1759) TaxID=1121448 RepID=T2GFV9_MEGG1|nr:30S ribosomal protein S16 [Megalodesulfovibrio gigas]AGW14837.1 putative 30S ribosomal protein S16 [Megalodesulfovibrio gigas DSM 1382 = ATCC 19364]
MAVKIRLTRMGSKKRPFYRIVAMDVECRRDGRALEILGFYNPMVNPAVINLEMDKLAKWLDQGAEPTDTVKSLIKQVKKAAA